MPIFYGGGRVAAAIELAVRDLGSELKPAASALSVACHSLSRQLATEFRMTGSRNGHTTHSSGPARTPTDPLEGHSDSRGVAFTASSGCQG